MARFRSKIFLPLLVLFGMIFVLMLQNRPVEIASVREGGSAPDFLLKDIGGRDVSLADFSGKLVVLNFWATWCPPCREEMPSMQKLYRTMQGRPFEMLAVSIDDDPKRVERFRSTMDYTFPILMDQNQEVAALYGTTGVPETFLIGPDGTILYKVIGPLDWEDPKNLAVIEEILSKDIVVNR
jgi:peroxiredoxin